jgi:hypothetical protein
LFFKEHNLDFNKKPKYENLYVVGDSIKTFIYNDVEFSYFSKRCEENVYFDMTTYSELYARKNGSIHTPKLIYSIYQEDKYYMAGQGFINYQSAYAENGYFIFEIPFYHFTAAAGDADSYIYHFSPVFKLSDFNK